MKLTLQEALKDSVALIPLALADMDTRGKEARAAFLATLNTVQTLSKDPRQPRRGQHLYRRRSLASGTTGMGADHG